MIITNIHTAWLDRRSQSQSTTRHTTMSAAAKVCIDVDYRTLLLKGLMMACPAADPRWKPRSAHAACILAHLDAPKKYDCS